MPPGPRIEQQQRDAVEQFHQLVAEGLNNAQASLQTGYSINQMLRLRKKYPELAVTRETYKDGVLVRTEHSVRENQSVDTEGMKVVGVTKSPYGGAYVKYANEEEKGPSAEEILESIKSIIEKNVDPIRIKKQPKTGKHLKIYTSDKHIGCPGFERRGQKNVFNKEVYEQRMQSLISQAADLKSFFGEFASVTYFDLGDNLDGFNNQTARGGHYLPQNMSSRQQFDAFFDVETRVIDALVENLGRINYVAQSVDNHAGAFGYTAYKALEVYINQKYPDCTTHVADEFMEHVKIGDETLIYCHGKDDKNMKFGMPLYPKSQTTAKITEYMDGYKIYDRVKFIKGDLHQFNYCTDKKYDYVNVPSIMGCSEWIYDNFGFTPAGAYIEVDDWSFPIWF